MLIMMANAKGGVGKTTLAIGIAGEFEARGYAVTMLDADSEQNLMRWYVTSQSDGYHFSKIKVQSIASGELEKVLAEKPDNEVYILDTPGRNADIIELALDYTDCIISPIKPVQNDLVGSSVVALIRNESKSGHRPAMLLVISAANMMDQKSHTYPMMQDYADQTSLPIAKTIIKNRICMTEIYSGMGTIQTYLRDLKNGATLTDGIKAARLEFQQLTDEIIETVQNS